MEHSVRILVRNATVDQMYTDATRILPVLRRSRPFRAMWRMWASGNNSSPENSITRAKRPSSSGVMRGAGHVALCATITLTIPRVTSVLNRFALTRCGGWKTMKLRRGTTSAPKMGITIQEICSAMLRYAYLMEDSSSEASRALALSDEETKWETPSKPSSREEEKVGLGLRARDCHDLEGEFYARQDDEHAVKASITRAQQPAK